jgi:polar amino acid transport system permease protein
MTPPGFFTSWPEWFVDYLPGLWVTLELTVLSVLVGLPLGMLFAVGASAKGRPLRWTMITIIEIGRGVPGLIVLYLVYYGLPQINILLPAFWAAVAGLSFTTAAYTSEIIRIGIKSVPQGQREAARALALSSTREFRLVILPQAFRLVVPPLIGLIIILFQATSLAYAISVPELLSRAYSVASVTYQFASALTLAGLIYAVISLSVTLPTHARTART